MARIVIRIAEDEVMTDPWSNFLAARAAAIDWLYSGKGDPNAKGDDRFIATVLSMDAEQVTMIRARDRTKEGKA